MHEGATARRQGENNMMNSSTRIAITFNYCGLPFFTEQEVNLDEYVQTDLKSRNSTRGLWRRYKVQDEL